MMKFKTTTIADGATMMNCLAAANNYDNCSRPAHRRPHSDPTAFSGSTNNARKMKEDLRSAWNERKHRSSPSCTPVPSSDEGDSGDDDDHHDGSFVFNRNEDDDDVAVVDVVDVFDESCVFTNANDFCADDGAVVKI